MPKNEQTKLPTDPVERLAAVRHEFGEHGGVNMSIEASTTFTVMEAGTMPEIFQGDLVQTKVVVFMVGISTRLYMYLVVNSPLWKVQKRAIVRRVA